MFTVAVCGGSGLIGRSIVSRFAVGARVRRMCFSQADAGQPVSAEQRGVGRDVEAVGADVRDGVAPGVVRADKAADIKAIDPHRRHLVEDSAHGTPLGHLTDPGNVSGPGALLISNCAADISGQIIGADGGYSA